MVTVDLESRRQWLLAVETYANWLAAPRYLDMDHLWDHKEAIRKIAA